MSIAILIRVLQALWYCGNVAENEMMTKFPVLYINMAEIQRRVQICNIQGHSYFITYAMA